MFPTSRVHFAPAAALLAALAVACSDATGSENSPLAGLTQKTAADSVGNPVPGEPPAPTPGTFHGNVLGACASSCTGDTLATSPRASGVAVKAYKVTGGTASDPTLGSAEATVTTGSDGKFQFPQLSGGEYVVTFTPPSSSAYRGVWVTAHTSDQSDDRPWWVVLPRK